MSPRLQAIGKEIWGEWVKSSTEDAKDRVVDIVKDRLRELVTNTNVHPMYVFFYRIHCSD